MILYLGNGSFRLEDLIVVFIVCLIKLVKFIGWELIKFKGRGGNFVKGLINWIVDLLLSSFF